MYCIETIHLSHRFSGTETVLEDINIQVPAGAIYGFLGPNGAGKTTTLRLLLGLLRKQEGSIRLFGQPLETNRTALLKRTGSLIEAPSIYPHLTATENLSVLQKVYQCPKTRIDEVLHTAGLQHTGQKKTGTFSLGMKQRLSIAIALLHNPSLLILDEPTNGLDPEGIIEMRALLKRLNREQGMTILVSSHLLPEIEKLATHTGIIHKGHLLFQGTLGELQQRQALTTMTSFTTDNTAKTITVMKAHALEPIVADDVVTVPVQDRTMVARLNEQLVHNQVTVYQIGTQRNDLESIFIDLVKN